MTYATLTNLGRQKEAAALAAGTPLVLTHMAWGDGTRSPAGAETALQSEKGRKPINGTGPVTGALHTAYFEIILDLNEGPFVIHEAGIFDADGDLFAVAKFDPPVNKPLQTVSALVRITVAFSNLDNLILNVQSADAYVPFDRAVRTGDGLLGGGDLSADRTISADYATPAQARVGSNLTKLMTPALVTDRFAEGGEMKDLVVKGQLTAEAADDQQDANILLRDDADVPQGALYWDRLNDRLGLRRFNVGGVAVEGELDMDADQLRWNGNRIWDSGDAPAQISPSGYQRLPSGLLIQWGAIAHSNGAVITFPMAFPAAVFGITFGEVNAGGIATNAHLLGYDSMTVAGFTLTSIRYDGLVETVANGGTYLAIGH